MRDRQEHANIPDSRETLLRELWERSHDGKTQTNETCGFVSTPESPGDSAAGITADKHKQQVIGQPLCPIAPSLSHSSLK